MNLSKCIGWFCLALAAFFLCLVLFPSCTHSVDPEPRVDVVIAHHTAELKKHTLEEMQGLYSPAMLFIGEKTLNTIPAGMEITVSLVIGTELAANWIEFDPHFGMMSVRVQGWVVDRDTTLRIGE
jgi:hypothetical protein